MEDDRKILEKELFLQVPDIKDKELIIWGTGNTALLYQEGLERLKDEGFYVTTYCDNNSEKWGKEFCGKPVICPNELRERKDVCVLICTPTPELIHSIKEQLKDYNVPYYLLDEVILKQHAIQVLQCYDLLEDSDSKKVYTDIIFSHIRGNYPRIENCNYKDAYFAVEPFKHMNRKEVFVDCGAYVGDTLEKYVWNRDGIFHKIIAFEPDTGNFTAMGRRVKRLKEEWNLREDAIALLPYGVSDKNTMSVLETYDSGLGSKFIEGAENAGESVKIVALDKIISEPYSFLKADIESYEYKMLRGAQKGIKENKPLMAICIYHNAVDLYTIPLFIKTMVSGYKMAVRHHSDTLAETVLYCWYPNQK